jgi:hypothetical protein
MADHKRDDEAKGVWREPSPLDDDPTVIAPRFDEGEKATARPVIPLGRTDNGATSTGTMAGAGGGFSLRAVSRHLVLVWAVVATLAVGAVAVYRSAHTPEPQAVPEAATENMAGVAATATPRPARREVRVAPARAAKINVPQEPSSSWEVPGWSDRGDVERGGPDEEKLEERARKEEKRRRKEEKKRREEVEENAERALKDARKQAERLRERMKDEGKKSRLIEVLTGRAGM